MPIVEGYHQFGGQHPETAALKNLMAAAELKAPHTGEPLSDAMVLGISGGLGAGYILWEFQEHRTKVLVLGFHNRWQYPIEFYQLTCNRLGVKAGLLESGSKKTALNHLTSALEKGTPALAWVDRASMPYLQLPEAMKGHIGHFIVVCGREGDTFLIDDLAEQPYPVSSEMLAEARARISSYKNRLLVIEHAPTEIDLPAAVMQGLQDCVTHLSSPSESFSLPTIRKWGKTMTDSKNKKGWLKLFEDRRGLYSTLRSIFDGIELGGAPGGLRGLYADFLVEAARLLDKPELVEVAERYRTLGTAWSSLAEAALPDEVSIFKEAKQLMRERHAVLMQGGEAWRNTQAITEQLRHISTEYNLEFPLEDIVGLFTALQDRLLSIYEAEVQALAALKSVLASV